MGEMNKCLVTFKVQFTKQKSEAWKVCCWLLFIQIHGKCTKTAVAHSLGWLPDRVATFI